VEDKLASRSVRYMRKDTEDETDELVIVRASRRGMVSRKKCSKKGVWTRNGLDLRYQEWVSIVVQ
jgi:hypothetical protein